VRAAAVNINVGFFVWTTLKKQSCEGKRGGVSDKLKNEDLDQQYSKVELNPGKTTREAERKIDGTLGWNGGR